MGFRTLPQLRQGHREEWIRSTVKCQVSHDRRAWQSQVTIIMSAMREPQFFTPKPNWVKCHQCACCTSGEASAEMAGPVYAVALSVEDFMSVQQNWREFA